MSTNIVSEATIAALTGIATSSLATVMHELGYQQQFMLGLSDLGGVQAFVAKAVTVRFVPSRPDLLGNGDPFREMLDQLPAECALVVDSGHDLRGAIFGDLMAQRLIARQVSAIVTDGAVRDNRALRELPLGVYAGGVSASSRNGFLFPVGLGEPVSCAEVTVLPDDLLVADGDGVLVVPDGIAVEVARLAREREEFEEFAALALAQGAPLHGTYPPDEETLARYHRWLSDGRRPDWRLDGAT